MNQRIHYINQPSSLLNNESDIISTKRNKSIYRSVSFENKKSLSTISSIKNNIKNKIFRVDFSVVDGNKYHQSFTIPINCDDIKTNDQINSYNNNNNIIIQQQALSSSMSSSPSTSSTISSTTRQQHIKNLSDNDSSQSSSSSSSSSSPITNIQNIASNKNR
jgi:hypothetical protein